MLNILVVAQESDVLRPVAEAFVPEAWVEQAPDVAEARALLHRLGYHLLFADLDLLAETVPGASPQAALQSLWQLNPALEIFVMAPPERVRDAMACVKSGAAGYLAYPFTARDVTLAAGGAALPAGDVPEPGSEPRTNSPAMRRVLEAARQVAPTDSTVLLTGETGTGKGFLARLLHKQGNRSAHPFVSVHCGAIPETLLESELFGHEKGAFTGAVKKKRGRFELAGDGTLFLDEIGTVPPPAQVKLLQVLQEGVFHRVGGEEPVASRARIIAATNMDLQAMCAEGTFRSDLYYRLNVFPIELPPLRDRLEDLPLLAEGFLAVLNSRNPKRIRGISPDALAALSGYHWPGNIRELENLLERAHILEQGEWLSRESFPRDLAGTGNAKNGLMPDISLPLTEARRKGLDEIEARYLRAVLGRHRGRINETAEAAGISPRYLHKLMARHGIDKNDFK